MSATQLKIFISSVQNEFKAIRRDIKAFLLGDAVLRRFISEVFLFEEIPAKDLRADQVYLKEVERCDIYLGIFGYEYGHEDKNGISPTEHEYNHATRHKKTRLIYIWGTDDKKRHPKMKKLVKNASNELIRRRIEDVSALNAEVYASIVDYLDGVDALLIPPFDTAICDNASLKDISRRRIDWFLETAHRERGFPLKPNTTTKALLTHLNLLDSGKPCNAAMLLFGVNPQRYHRTAEIKCIHCHGTQYRRPFASLQVYGGDLFDQANQARDFVLAKINRAIGTRAAGITAPAAYELPPEAVGEAIVNAIAHRDYHSNASIEIRLYADRLEVWNPGVLPGTLTLDSLRDDHPSIPYNPMLAESLYLTRYIERVGSGTQVMIELCREANLPEPEFEQKQGSFVITLWRDWLTAEVMDRLELNDRQIVCLKTLKVERQISTMAYQNLVGCSRRTAARDLDGMLKKGIIQRLGAGRSAYYVIVRNRVINVPNVPSSG